MQNTAHLVVTLYPAARTVMVMVVAADGTIVAMRSKRIAGRIFGRAGYTLGRAQAVATLLAASLAPRTNLAGVAGLVAAQWHSTAPVAGSQPVGARALGTASTVCANNTGTAIAKVRAQARATRAGECTVVGKVAKCA